MQTMVDSVSTRIRMAPPETGAGTLLLWALTLK